MKLVTFVLSLLCTSVGLWQARTAAQTMDTDLREDALAFWKLTTALSKNSNFQNFLNVTWGIDGFEIIMGDILAKASWARSGTPASLRALRMSRSAVIAKICFPDDTCWAAKIQKDNLATVVSDLAGIKSMVILEQVCPDIPSLRCRGYGRTSRPAAVLYTFTEWIEGKILYDWIDSDMEVNISRSNLSSIRIPDKLVTSLAEFAYNLSTCQIPEKHCK